MRDEGTVLQGPGKGLFCTTVHRGHAHSLIGNDGGAWEGSGGGAVLPFTLTLHLCEKETKKVEKEEKYNLATRRER